MIKSLKRWKNHVFHSGSYRVLTYKILVDLFDLLITYFFCDGSVELMWMLVTVYYCDPSSLLCMLMLTAMHLLLLLLVGSSLSSVCYYRWFLDPLLFMLHEWYNGYKKWTREWWLIDLCDQFYCLSFSELRLLIYFRSELLRKWTRVGLTY